MVLLELETCNFVKRYNLLNGLFNVFLNRKTFRLTVQFCVCVQNVCVQCVCLSVLPEILKLYILLMLDH